MLFFSLSLFGCHASQTMIHKFSISESHEITCPVSKSYSLIEQEQSETEDAFPTELAIFKKDLESENNLFCIKLPKNNLSPKQMRDGTLEWLKQATGDFWNPMTPNEETIDNIQFFTLESDYATHPELPKTADKVFFGKIENQLIQIEIIYDNETDKKKLFDSILKTKFELKN